MTALRTAVKAGRPMCAVVLHKFEREHDFHLQPMENFDLRWNFKRVETSSGSWVDITQTFTNLEGEVLKQKDAFSIQSIPPPSPSGTLLFHIDIWETLWLLFDKCLKSDGFNSLSVI